MLLGVAMMLLVVAIVWSSSIGTRDELQKIAEEINAFGYNFEGEDIYVLGESGDTSIATMLNGDDLDSIISASKEAGFPSDVDAVGDYVVLLIQVDENNNIITLFLRNGVIELGFVQNVDTQAIRVLGQ